MLSRHYVNKNIKYNNALDNKKYYMLKLIHRNMIARRNMFSKLPLNNFEGI